MKKSIYVLKPSANLLPMADKVKLINRCIDTNAFILTKESQFSSSSSTALTCASSKDVIDWWAEDLIFLKIDIFQRVLLAMISRGFKQYALGPILMLYAQKCLRGLVVVAYNPLGWNHKDVVKIPMSMWSVLTWWSKTTRA